MQNQHCDRETGLHYNFFRYYERNVEDLLTKIGIGLMGGTNFYQFAMNALGEIDPLGLSKKGLRLL